MVCEQGPWGRISYRSLFFYVQFMGIGIIMVTTGVKNGVLDLGAAVPERNYRERKREWNEIVSNSRKAFCGT